MLVQNCWLKRILSIFILVVFFLFSSDYAMGRILDDNLDSKQSASFDEEEYFDNTFEENTNTKKNYLTDASFTFSHHFSYGTQKSVSETITNRSFLRCKFDKSFSEIFFIKFDGKACLYFNNDHIAKTSGKETDYDGNIREFYLQAGFENFIIKAGKQLVVWGETDGDVINDVVSPRDESEFIFIDLEDSRIGNYMASMDIYSGFGNFFLFATAKPFVNNTPDKGTRYYQDSGLIGVKDEKRDFSDNEAGFKWKKIHNKFEISLMTASLLQNKGVLENKSINENVYGRFNFYGLGTSYTNGSFLFKLDASFKEGYLLQSLNNAYHFTKNKSKISDSAFGIDYDANGKYMMNFELSNRHIFDYKKELYGMKKNNTGFYFQFNKKYLNDTLTFQYSLYHQLQEKNSFHKSELDYSFSDDISLRVDYTFFQIKDDKSFLWYYRNEDRIAAEFKYYF